MPITAATHLSPPIRSGSSRALGRVLVSHGVLTPDTLPALRADAEAAGVGLGDLLIARGLVSRAALMNAQSRVWNMGQVTLATAPPDPGLLARCDIARCLRLGCLPWRRVGRTTILAVADPEQVRHAAEACRVPAGRVALALADPERIRETLSEAHAAALAERACTRTPEDLSCRSWGHLTGPVAGVVMALALLALLIFGWVHVLSALLVFAILSNFATALLRGYGLALAFLRHPRHLPGTVPRLAEFRRRPSVSVLVPLYRETAVLDPLLTALSRLDYPAELLEILLVLEEDDTPMRAALSRRRLPGNVRIATAPGGRPRTKPRAMNYALDLCRGEIIGIYDAEDQPDPGQISAIVAAFAEQPAHVACIQARLGYFNAGQNWLSRCFAIEYASWFNVILKGVQHLGLPVPLGGTSVFFRREALETVGAWDAHNVTEDADLGIRLARFGYRTEVIDSVTLEEANCRAWPWVKQRSRWLKGYMVTWITHMRQPRRLWRDLGPVGFIGVQVLLLGGATAYLALPLLWIGWALGSLVGLPPWVAALPDPVLTVFFASLIGGQVVMIATCARALTATRQMRLLPWVLTLPVYWPLGAMAAYKALFELVVAPFYWDKTSHGLAGAHAPPADEFRAAALGETTPAAPAQGQEAARAAPPAPSGSGPPGQVSRW